MANPNPTPKPENLTAARFAPGQSGNPGGKTSEQRKLEVENAERATRLHNRMLVELEDELDEAKLKGDKAAVKMITANILKLIKDAQDRGLGTPVQSVNVESPNGTMTPQVITRRVVDPKNGTDD